MQAKAEAAEQATRSSARRWRPHRRAERLTAAQGERDQAKRDAAQARGEAAGFATSWSPGNRHGARPGGRSDQRRTQKDLINRLVFLKITLEP